MKLLSLRGICDVSRRCWNRAVSETERIFWGWIRASDQTQKTREDFLEEVAPET